LYYEIVCINCAHFLAYGQLMSVHNVPFCPAPVIILLLNIFVILANKIVMMIYPLQKVPCTIITFWMILVTDRQTDNNWRTYNDSIHT